jgi:vacuolar-type H+-ATPase subunit H
MKNNQNADSPGPAIAIDRVLEAEADARQAMQDCDQQAEQIIEAAREDARRIARRANQRAAGLNERCDRLIADKARALREQAQKDRAAEELDPSEVARVDEAVSRVAARLTRSDA